MLRFCYVGHRFHERSESTSFLLELLRDIGQVDVFASDPDADPSEDDKLVAQIAGARYDCHVFLQTEYVAARLRPFITGRVIIVPMYDGAVGRPDLFWQQFVHATFISFSRTHHEHLETLGCRSAHFAFFPALQPATDYAFVEAGAFFWERRPDTKVNLHSVLQLCRQLDITSLHVHSAPDFESLARPMSRLDPHIEAIKLTRSQWFEKRQDYDVIAGAPLFFFAPRLTEGIGMTVLEAMSRGQIVVAPDLPTVNEYISHGTTGILYNPDNPNISLRLEEAALKQISAAARQKIEYGRADWLADTHRLRSILLNDGQRWSTRDVSSHFMNSLRRSASQRAFADGRAGRVL